MQNGSFPYRCYDPIVYIFFNNFVLFAVWCSSVASCGFNKTHMVAPLFSLDLLIGSNFLQNGLSLKKGRERERMSVWPAAITAITLRAPCMNSGEHAKPY